MYILVIFGLGVFKYSRLQLYIAFMIYAYYYHYYQVSESKYMEDSSTKYLVQLKTTPGAQLNWWTCAIIHKEGMFLDICKRKKK